MSSGFLGAGRKRLSALLAGLAMVAVVLVLVPGESNAAVKPEPAGGTDVETVSAMGNNLTGDQVTTAVSKFSRSC
ncbi:hypothetical protein [Actinopolymorpha alba]|uniref:hypothetical protein n=1 Tax=Actinopolymorpha alba TaxID=533267 RepID=UPI0012F6D0FF|nr:hypothetical protein [Actinopolymorpha alba]